MEEPCAPSGSGPPTILARADGPFGETVLRRRGDVLELVVAGVFAMDSAHTSTEVALARQGLGGLDDAHRVLVGGLGLGYTAQAVLADPRVRELTVVELDAALVSWARAGLVPVAAQVLAEPRTTLVADDVLNAVPALAAGGLDAVLLDVDNGPGFLVHPSNTGVYTAPFLRACARALRPGGVVAVWSADLAPALRTVLGAEVGRCEEILLPVERDGRAFTYALYLAARRCPYLDHERSAHRGRSMDSPSPIRYQFIRSPRVALSRTRRSGRPSAAIAPASTATCTTCPTTTCPDAGRSP